MKSKISMLIVCALFFMMSCSPPPPVEKSEILSTHQLDGKSIFKTVFFSLGDVATKIPSFKENVELLTTRSQEDAAFMPDYIANVDNYIAQIEKQYPSYFDELKTAIYSQDFLKIKRAMQLGDLLILPTVIQSNLDNIEYEPLKREIMSLEIESVDFQNEQKLKDLTQSILAVMSKYKDNYQELDVNSGRCLWVTFAAVGNFVYFVNVAWTGNINWNVNWSIPFQSSGYDYDNYLGEELIKEVAFGFNK